MLHPGVFQAQNGLWSVLHTHINHIVIQRVFRVENPSKSRQSIIIK